MMAFQTEEKVAFAVHSKKKDIQILVLTSRWSLRETNKRKRCIIIAQSGVLGRCSLQDWGRTWGEKARRFWPRQEQAEEGRQTGFRL